ncbi:DUF2384 domain-containing protein [Xanthomonas vasicola pv. vasculorum]|uniref:DUF2384 domain-containing protein n=2 Tax=Xanthomonas vasicola pv. vasculorum TaxID=325776 RepID=A0AAE8F916_XANVA|nr:DUF2384 domain-containing protein [Xanthomonas vasicola pv. vasculorum]AZR29150.1 DUF2384 domain-containing protein [Xanthomonas vasicola pv. arecae]AZR33090.1 DUF2384 domain-containing protein [Xanthomonas vasicola pv. musacearum NCPPB 4379]AZR37122.1 DUF2384 domain-containing protein [Xanthomonas vasicola]RRJ36572.1 DUF2384 domain-containing protein [Xanthomonas vasicola pv. musacearum]
MEYSMERADLIAAVLTGMRRAEDFRAQALIYSTAHSQQMEVDHGKAADAELLLSLFAFTPEHLKLLGTAGIENLGEIVCHAWALNGGNNEALIGWFRKPMNALDGQTPSAMVRSGSLQVLLLVLRQQLEWELPRSV